MTDWEIIHSRFPLICEGQGRKGQYKGCCAWNGFQMACNSRITNGGECHLTVEAAIKREKLILKGHI